MPGLTTGADRRFAMLYFAYGSNMLAEQMARLCPGSKPVNPARLHDHRLVFNRLWDGWGGSAVASVEPCTGAVVEGVLWEISEADRAALDRFEDFPASYLRQDVMVETFEGRSLPAYTYVARPQGNFRPRREYLEQVITGGRQHGLSPEYLASLEAIATEG